MIAGLSDRALDRAIKAALGVFALLVIAFGLYYFFDRYYRPPQPSLLEQQVTRLEQAAREDPGNLAARFALGELYLERRQYKNAIDQLSQVLSLDERNDRVLADMGLAYMNLGDKAQAQDFFRKAVEIGAQAEIPGLVRSLPVAHYWLGRMALEQGDNEAALDNLTKASRLNPIDADALVALGQAYLAGGRTDDAVGVLTKAVAMVPNYAEGFLALAQAYEAKGDKEKAASAYQEALDWDKGNREARAGLARLTGRR